jgi:hypothetical protein
MASIYQGINVVENLGVELPRRLNLGSVDRVRVGHGTCKVFASWASELRQHFTYSRARGYEQRTKNR